LLLLLYIFISSYHHDFFFLVIYVTLYSLQGAANLPIPQTVGSRLGVDLPISLMQNIKDHATGILLPFTFFIPNPRTHTLTLPHPTATLPFLPSLLRNDVSFLNAQFL
jgi:hypothetical protein